VNFRLQDERELTVLGIHARVSNAAPEKIGDLWRKFHALGDAKSIETRLNDAVYSVYCEYEGDFTAEYTVLIGCAVDADAAVPEAMKKIKIEAGKFAVFEPVGELPRSLWETWAKIWQTQLDRRYEADFDRYGSDGKVTVYVGVR
jgi:predicted transcriptional regulator YdeE